MAAEFMHVEEAKKMICEVGRRMYARGYVASNDGNISILTGDDEVVCTPTGVSKGYMTPDMMCVIKRDGKQVSGHLQPSSEIKMHLRVYLENPTLRAVCHAHPPMATAYAVIGRELVKPILVESVVLLGPVHIAPFAKPGTKEVPDSIAPFCANSNAVLLANHGALTWGRDILEAYYRMESLEHYATILTLTTQTFHSDKELTKEQVAELKKIKENLGL